MTKRERENSLVLSPLFVQSHELVLTLCLQGLVVRQVSSTGPGLKPRGDLSGGNWRLCDSARCTKVLILQVD